MSQVLEMWRTTTRWPLGERVFSFAFARRAPYFASIRPRFTEIRDDPDVPVRVRGVRRDGTVVVEGTIRLWVTPRPPR